MSALNGTSILTKLPQRHREQKERGGRKNINARGWRESLLNNIFWTWHGYCNHECEKAVAICTLPKQDNAI